MTFCDLDAKCYKRKSAAFPFFDIERGGILWGLDVRQSMKRT